MIDIISRLRAAHPNSAQRFAGSNILLDAADEIERLTKEKDYAIRWANKAVEDVKASFYEELAGLRKALERQGDNMAFVINHVTIPKQWMEKFIRELEEDRATLISTKKGEI